MIIYRLIVLRKLNKRREMIIPGCDLFALFNLKRHLSFCDRCLPHLIIPNCLYFTVLPQDHNIQNHKNNGKADQN